MARSKNFRRLVPLAAGALLLGGCASVDVGNVGVVADSLSGKVSDKPIGAGFHIIGPFKRVFQFPSGVVDNITLDNFKINTSEGQEISVDIRVQYLPKLTTADSNAVDLFKRYRKPFEGDHGLVASRWIPVIQQAAGYAFSQQGVIQVYQSRGARAAAIMSQILQNGLKTADVQIDGIGDDFVHIQTVAISDINLPEGIKNAVERKAQIEQETLSARQGLEKARMEAEKQKIDAQAEADSKFIRAKGEANARAALGISPEQYTRIELAKMTTDALKHSKNMIIVPNNAILDTRALIGPVPAPEKP